MAAKNDNKPTLADIQSEHAILACLILHGTKKLADIESILKKEDFYDRKHQALYACLQKAISDDDLSTVTIDCIQTTANTLNIVNLIPPLEGLGKFYDKQINMEEVPLFLRKIKFWSIVRALEKRCIDVTQILSKLNGDESIATIVSQAEETIFDFLPDIINEEEISNFSELLEAHVEHLANNPVDMIGLPSGFPRYDKKLGGGLRRGAINVIGARPGVGKSFICLNIAKNVAELGVPVLYLDTELTTSYQMTRWLALISDVDIDLIETGKFSKSMLDNQKINDAVLLNNAYKFHHINIGGRSVDEIISTVRRWLNKVVGKDKNGATNDCLIVLDYIKTMDLKDIGGQFREDQYLGDMVTKIHNLSVKNDIPVLAAVQLNRDGITKDSSDVISASDRILWLASSVAILKDKSSEDFASGDGVNNGNKKMVLIKSRFGTAMDVTTEYINIMANLARSKMTEGKYNHENQGIESIITYADDEETFI